MEQLEKGRQGRPGSHYYLPLQVLVGTLITLIFCTLVFGGLEFAVRIWHYRRLGPNSLHPVSLHDQFTAWRNNPAYGRVDRHIDAQGFRRDQDVSLEKPPNTVRVFIAGGSTAYGWTTGWPDINPDLERLYNNQTISYYLEQDLNQDLRSKHWEVINAGSPSYTMNVELAQIQSVLLRYRPDCVILLDGHNDLGSLLRHITVNYDPYTAIPDELTLPTNPGSFGSLLFFINRWLRNNSAAFRVIGDRMQEMRYPPPNREARTPELSDPVRLSDLTSKEQAQFTMAQSQLAFYPRLARQIHRVLELDGVKPIFLLQPELMLTHKQLTDREQRMIDYQRKNRALLLYGYQQLYPEIGTRMASTGQQDGFAFVNLIDVFDRTADQTFSDDCHLTPLGNRIIAERLFHLLKEMFANHS
jgi:lysophospholipase L1-like esterase